MYYKILLIIIKKKATHIAWLHTRAQSHRQNVPKAIVYG